LERSAKFWNRLAKRYAATPVKHEDDYQTKLAATRRYLTPASEVFEFGCGTGSTAISHAPHVKHIHAVDYSSAMIEIAKRKAEAAGIDNIDFECASIHAVDKPADSVDVVMAHSILHLLPNAEQVVVKAYAMLKPGGAFVSSTACIREMGVVAKAVPAILRFVPFAPFLNAMTQADVEAMLTRAGFTIDYRWRPATDRAAFIVAKKPPRDA
jgi:ubiquinone/menaquinone biosynthesis C-methylase UbiE